MGWIPMISVTLYSFFLELDYFDSRRDLKTRKQILLKSILDK